MLRFACLTALIVSLGACADHPYVASASDVQEPAMAASGTQVAQAPQQICHRELPVGSNIPVTRCHAPEGADAQSNANGFARAPYATGLQGGRQGVRD